jgi:hypothetical protein
VADDALQRAYERVREANARLDALWPVRYEQPAEFRAAIDDLNAAGAELNRISEASAN